MMKPSFLLGVAPALLVSLGACSVSGEAIPAAQGDDATPPPGPTAAPPGDRPTAFRPTGVALDRVDVPRDPAASIDPAALAGAVTANNAFAFDLYAHVLASRSTPGNVMTSPLAASLALTMAYAGAQGQTSTEMATALHFGDAAASIFDGQNALSAALVSRASDALAQASKSAASSGRPAPTGSDYQLEVVDSVWGEQTYPWAQPFLTTLAKSYGTGVYLRDFVHQPEEARLTVDGWVSQETGGMIADLLPPGSVDDTTRVVLVDALHLRMPWDAPFDPSATANAVFTRGDGTSVSTPFMNAKPRGLPYVDDGKAQIVAVPLAGRSLSAVFALPHGDLATYEAGLTALSVPATQPMVALSLPRFAFASRGVSLAGPLQAMGMKQAFSATDAQFQGMCDAPPDGAHLYVGDVLQETTIGVGENGLEASAATAVAEPGIATQDPVVLTFDRPFVVAIVDASGAVIFLGHVEDPTATTGN